MYRTGFVQVYDMMSQVHVVATIRTYEKPDGEAGYNDESTFSVTYPSVGQENDEKWLLDALVALAETL